LGRRAVLAWCEITDNPTWRSPASTGETTQEAVEAFVELTANIKHSVQFQALYEGAPQLLIQLLFIVRDRDEFGPHLGNYELQAWLRLMSVCTSAVGLVLNQMDFLCENDRFLHRVWKRDAAPIMLCTLVDLMCALATSIVPLVLLLDHNVYTGVVALVLQVLAAAYATMKNGDHSDPDAEAVIDLFLIPFLFFPHAFFFAMTYYPGAAEEGPNRGQALDYHTAKHAMISQNATILAVTHGVYAILIGVLIALVPACCYDWFDPDTTAEDFNGAFRVEAAFTTLGVTLPLMAAARVGVYQIHRHKKELFDQESTPVLNMAPTTQRSTLETRALSFISDKSVFIAKHAKAAWQRSKRLFSALSTMARERLSPPNSRSRVGDVPSPKREELQEGDGVDSGAEPPASNKSSSGASSSDTSSVSPKRGSLPGARPGKQAPGPPERSAARFAEATGGAKLVADRV